MEQDIRKLFETDEFPTKKLPANHEDEFAQKLKLQAPKKRRSNLFFLKVAASVAIIFTLGYVLVNSMDKGTQPTELQKQVAEIEKNYLKQIDQEWEAFVKTTNDQDLVKYYKETLDDLKEDYDKISIQFSQEPNNIPILEELIKNLQRRLDLLKNIQEHIKVNKKSKHYETIII